MRIRKSIFGSKSEQQGFRSMSEVWGDTYEIYPNLPFAQVFEDENIGGTWHLFYKTSIDYTLCTRGDGRPLVGIDFDGMGGGFSRGGEYVPLRKTKDLDRKAKFDFKLSCSQRCGFPYYVLSYDEIEPINADMILAIRDGIIGQELSRAELKKQIAQISPQELEVADNLSPDERSDYLQNLVTDLESDAELTLDPIVKKYHELATELTKLGCRIRGGSFRTYHAPELPGETESWPLSFETVKARIEAMRQVREVKCVCTWETSIGEISDLASMRNVGDIGQTLVIVKNVAELLTCSKALRLMKKQHT